MKKILLIVALLAVGLSAVAQDQFGTRYSAGINYKVFKGFHLTASEEVRLGSDFSFDRSYSNLGVSYKINDYLKTALDYDAIAVNKTSGLDWRHRVSLGVSESLSWNEFKFSLKETFQATYRVKDINTLQNPRTKLVFKTRAKVSYKPFHSRFTPYAQAELKLVLNGANWVTENGSTYTFDGHNDLYVNRIRFQGGTQYNFDKQNALEFFLLYDYLIDKDIDASRSKGTLKSITITQYPFFGLGLGYTFSF